MRREHIIRIFAGILTLVGLGLGYWVHPGYLLISAFVGLNLLQSGITKWCLLEDILGKFNIGTPCKTD